jgi:5-oxoprolinase (ATP-hydrolysing)
MVGKIQPAHFPAIFGPQGDQPLDAEVVRTRFAALAGEISAATGRPMSPAEVAEGFLRVAVANMANAIKQVSIQKGHDAARFALQCFGGAGGQHACLVADALGMETVFIHPFAGVLSAYGMGLADQTVIREAAVEAPLQAEGMAGLATRLDALEQAGRAELVRQGAPERGLHAARRLHLRYAGTDSFLPVPFGPHGEVLAAFTEAHAGHASASPPRPGPSRRSLRGRGTQPGGGGGKAALPPRRKGEPGPILRQRCRCSCGGIAHGAPGARPGGAARGRPASLAPP